MIYQIATHECSQQRAMRTGISRNLIIVLWILGLYISLLPSTNANECTFPDNVNWVVDQSCEISGIQIAPRSLSVIDGAVLTVQNSGELMLDMRNFRINVDPESRIAVEPGGRIRSNEIGPLLVRETDGGTFGYFLKRVGGPVIDTINPDLSFHPSSAIKTIYMIEALRQVDNGTLNLNTTNMTSCTTTITPGGTNCPNPFTNPTTGGGGGGNCTVPPIVNSLANCGNSTQTYGLGLGICAMMQVSNNAATNAIQETVGAGNPLTGWNNMLNNAGNVIGLSAATTFANRMGCGGPFNNNPNNQTTLRDLGLIYEQMTTNPAVLFPVTPQPVPFIFQNTNAYNFMDNDSNELSNIINQAMLNTEASDIGLSSTTATNFRNAVRLVHKTGLNRPGGGTANPNCLTPAQPIFVTAAGWVSLPINGGANTRDYVYGVFINNVTMVAGSQPNSQQCSLFDEVRQMLRSVIRDALEDF